jgi:transcriptional regulator with XRE-family HTH domain
VNIAKVFGANVRTARKRLGLSQEKLAVGASLHRTEIGLVERGERGVRLETAIKLAGALKVPLSELIEGIAWAPGSTERGVFINPLARNDARKR